MQQNFKITDETTSDVIEYSIMKFPAGEVQVTLTNSGVNPGADVTIKGSIFNSDNLMELLQLVEVLRYEGYENLYLTMPYCAYSRQDRRCNYGESFSLKVFATIINSCKFKTVITIDNHSDVATALINNCINIDMLEMSFMHSLDFYTYDAIISPDAGANKKVFSLASYYKKPMIRADKVRDTKTGKITETTIYATTEDLKNKHVLITDDICEGGRTFVELAKSLKTIEPNVKIDLFVTHGFFSKGVEPLIEAGINRVYTTNTITSMERPNVEVLTLEGV